jgi:hypothetical protein
MSPGPQPESFAKNGTEHGHQVALFCWAAQNFSKYPALRLMFAIPNGGERNVIVAGNLKAEGVRSGIPDIFLPVPIAHWHGLFIELKRPADKGLNRKRGGTTEEQDRWIAALYAQNYGVAVCMGWQAARDVIIQYLEYKQE